MDPRRCLTAAAALAFLLAAAAAQEKAKEEKVKVQIHLSAEHTPAKLKAGDRADLSFVTSSVKTKTKSLYQTSPVAGGVEVAAVKRDAKAAAPNKAVAVELLVTKDQATKIERVKAETVQVVEKGVSTMRPVPLRLELAKPAK